MQAPGSYDGAKADVFSAGATLLEVLLGHPRFMEVWAIAYYDYGQRTLEDLARSLRQATTRVVTDLESLIYTTETDVVAADAEAASGGGELTTLMNAQSYAQPSQFRQLVGLTISCIKLEPLRRLTSEDAASAAARCSSGAASRSFPPAAHRRRYIRRSQYLSTAAPGVDDGTTDACAGSTPESPLHKNRDVPLEPLAPLTATTPRYALEPTLRPIDSLSGCGDLVARVVYNGDSSGGGGPTAGFFADGAAGGCLKPTAPAPSSDKGRCAISSSRAQRRRPRVRSRTYSPKPSASH